MESMFRDSMIYAENIDSNLPMFAPTNGIEYGTYHKKQGKVLRLLRREILDVRLFHLKVTKESFVCSYVNKLRVQFI